MIVLLLVTKNEGDLLRLNIEHHLAWGVDHIAVADNMSTDDTPDILRSYGDQVSSTKFRDFIERRSIRMVMLGALKERYPGIEWAGVSDTDEFWWGPEGDMRSALAGVPEDRVAVNYEQKLYLPTGLDGDEGPIYCRRVHRTPGSASPLHTSYKRGKSWYRVSWLPDITDEHWCREVPHERGGPSEPCVLHYMIQDEQQFVEKVKRLRSWQTRRRRNAEAVFDVVRKVLRRPAPSPVKRDFKAAWWDVYASGGDDGLRDYYRNVYTVPAGAVPGHLDRGELVLDAGFADFMADRHGLEPRPAGA
ncbi:MAG: glycosyltransferase family 2 protein [Acidimicrobiia bacterium]|nr:glycosyltransferase family 2 protein [Acidimicrobiia bacterium]